MGDCILPCRSKLHARPGACSLVSLWAPVVTLTCLTNAQFLAASVGFGEVNVFGRGNGTVQQVQFAVRVVAPKPIQVRSVLHGNLSLSGDVIQRVVM